MNIIDVYLRDEYFNHTCNATIPESWGAVLDLGSNSTYGPHTTAFAPADEYADSREATAAAKELFNS